MCGNARPPRRRHHCTRVWLDELQASLFQHVGLGLIGQQQARGHVFHRELLAQRHLATYLEAVKDVEVRSSE